MAERLLVLRAGLKWLGVARARGGRVLGGTVLCTTVLLNRHVHSPDGSILGAWALGRVPISLFRRIGVCV